MTFISGLKRADAALHNLTKKGLAVTSRIAKNVRANIEEGDRFLQENHYQKVDELAEEVDVAIQKAKAKIKKFFGK